MPLKTMIFVKLEARLKPLEQLQLATLDYNDRLVHGAYISFRSFALWNGWFRLWGLLDTFSVMRMFRHFVLYNGTNHSSVVNALDTSSIPVGRSPETVDLMQSAHEIMQSVADGNMTEMTATDRIFELLSKVPQLPPNFPYRDPKAHFGHTGILGQLELSHWIIEWFKILDQKDRYG